MPGSDIITVVLCDDDPAFRKMARAVIQRSPSMHIVGEATNGREALRLVESLQPAVLIMDLQMPEMDGVEATIEIAARWPSVKVLIFSANTAMTDIEKTATAGARGFVSKALPNRLVEAIRRVQSGSRFVLMIGSSPVADSIE